jgi:hypothetical protein
MIYYRLKFYSLMVFANFFTTLLNLFPKSVELLLATLYFFISYFDFFKLDSMK